MKKFVMAIAFVALSAGSAFANDVVVEEKETATESSDKSIYCCRQATVVYNGTTANFNTCAETCELAARDLRENVNAWMAAIE